MRKLSYVFTCLLGLIVLMSISPTSHASERHHHQLTTAVHRQLDHFNEVHWDHQLVVHIRGPHAKKIYRGPIQRAANIYFNHNVQDEDGMLLFITKKPADYQLVMGQKVQKRFDSVGKLNQLITPRMNKSMDNQEYSLFVSQLIGNLDEQLPKPNMNNKGSKKDNVNNYVKTKHKHVENSVKPTSNNHVDTNQSGFDHPNKHHGPAPQGISMVMIVVVSVFIIGFIFFMYFLFMKFLGKLQTNHRAKNTYQQNHQAIRHSQTNHNDDQPPVITIHGNHPHR